MLQRLKNLTLGIHRVIAAIILQPFTVRIHAGIAREPWARLWYLARAFDPSGRGIVDLPVDIIYQLLTISKPTLYEWLRDGEKAGAFRLRRIRKNRCHIWLGSLHKLCKSLNLRSWGAVATVSLLEVNNQLRAVATGITTADLQDKSHFAARRSLKQREKQFYTPPSADAILAEGKRSSQKPAKGQVPFLLHVGQRRAFVSKGFVPFGASQQAIGQELKISEWTVRRHQRQLGLERRQLVQSKHAYQLIQAGIEWEADRCFAEPDLWFEQAGDHIQLYEPNGISSARRQGGHRLMPQRLFRYAGKIWLYRCNIYGVSHIRLTSMKASRHRLAQLIEKDEGAGGKRGIRKTDQCPDQNR